MRAVLVHSLPGRARFRIMPGGFDAAGFAWDITSISGIKSASFHPRTSSILVFYDTHIVSEQTIYQTIQKIEAPKPLLENQLEKAPTELAWSYTGYQLFHLFTPPALKLLVTLLGAIPYFIAGLKSLAGSRLDVPTLDAAAIGASLAQGSVNSASTLIMLLKTGEYLAWAKQRSHENLSAALFLKAEQVWGEGT